MTVKQAARHYAIEAATLDVYTRNHAAGVLQMPLTDCGACHRLSLRLDALSVALDMATAAESDERIRRSVAW